MRSQETLIPYAVPLGTFQQFSYTQYDRAVVVKGNLKLRIIKFFKEAPGTESLNTIRSGTRWLFS
ncbi:hypothetical protein NSMM_400105 [Nitrosomonas mobilis]|uniref:Uncharacterized protein n=1 Tax=Nitrosomonas mobilis TaxID=51642 RepID=A0A1G5SF74_9PROT|nr:hypothetical protein NSMM_400105 [Nitrosomonas mobilis]